MGTTAAIVSTKTATLTDWRARVSRADTAWSNSCTTSSSLPVADCASSVSRIG